MGIHVPAAAAPGALAFKPRHLYTRALSLLLVFTLFSCLSAHAQVLFGSMVGNVSDASGASIPGAAVKITQTATNQVFNTTTNESGGYTVANLPAGTYQVEITKE